MSSRKSKRRRIEVEFEEQPEYLEGAPEMQEERAVDKELAQQDSGADAGQDSEPPPEEVDAERAAKEREVWDAFREEHYELLEQLPLSLHRAFTLIHELDQQAQDNLTHIAPAVLKYVALRKAHAAAAAQPKEVPIVDGGATSETPGETVDQEVNGHTSPRVPNGNAPNGISTRTNSTNGVQTRQNAPSTSNSLASGVQNSTSTRELLVHIAQSSEEVTRACAEKVYLAQHAYDLVDRYIRGLDRAIKEQEASISLGLRPGTHPASIILPEVVVPQSTRGRVVATPPPAPIPALEIPEAIVPEPAPEPVPEAAPEAVEEPAVEEETAPPEEAEQPPAPSKERKKGKKRKKATASRRQTTEPATAASAPVSVVADAPPAEQAQAPLTLRIPAQNLPTPIVVDEMPPDPNEPRYCFCNQVSFGDMIACDNPTCAREWFHIGCVGLTKIPKGNWYCRECVKLMKRPKSRKRAR
ncbi:hypothetical protein FKP32DRAFT_1598936 [Trametes sanguinea]|nr:hypothetical protein FKP32DRAFT_1598936 [Trametes sanguinea]